MDRQIKIDINGEDITESEAGTEQSGLASEACYALDPKASLGANIEKVFRMKIAEEKLGNYEYINPNMMQEIMKTLTDYKQSEYPDDIDSWIISMFGA